MIITDSQGIAQSHTSVTSSHLTAEDSRLILYKLRDLNLLAERLHLSDGRRIDLKGCLHPDAPINGQVHYRLGLTNGEELLLGIDLKDSRLHLTLSATETGIPTRSRYLPITLDKAGRANCAQIQTTLDPNTADRSELQAFLQELVLACLPASN
jgi:hypothetical protein